MSARGGDAVVCVDFGSTFTKAALVERGTGRLLARAEHPTTIATDVLDGWRACRTELAGVDPRAADAEVRACSSAGGGLRIAVVGNEELVTAEAGRRVALSSGGKVVDVLSGAATGGLRSVDALAEARPDVVLLVGGTDDGEEDSIRTSAATLASARWPTPVVVAGNSAVRDEVCATLAAAGVPHVPADNVVPRIGVLAPDSARAAIRAIFVSHVIGGKELSADPAFAAMVHGATPDVVLAGVELLASLVGDVVVVDVGGATTDVHSCVEPDPEARAVVAEARAQRTVEGDLGMRWSALTTVAEDPEADAGLRAAAARRHDDPSFVPDGADAAQEAAYDERLATLAVRTALRRHAGRTQVVYDARGRVVLSTGRDLREVELVVGSGGALRHAGPDASARVLEAATAPDGWQLPERPRVLVDTAYVLAAAGLLADDEPDAARELLRMHLLATGTLAPWPTGRASD